MNSLPTQIKKEELVVENSDLGPVIWQLQPGVRNPTKIKKVCGHELEDQFFCAASAGAGTRHIGQGKCIEHEQLFIPRLLDVIGRGKNGKNVKEGEPTTGIQPRVLEVFERAAKIDPRVMHTLDTEIQALYGLLELQLSGLTETNVNDKISNSLQGLITKIAKMKEDRQTFEQAQSLDMLVVKNLIEGIMGIVISNTNEATARRILTEILNQVVKPMRANGTLTGEGSLPFADYEGAEDD